METAARTHPYTVRLTVDVDPAGNPIGWSVTQRRADDTPMAISTGTPGPFDTPTEAFEEALRTFTGVVGVLHTLFE